MDRDRHLWARLRRLAGNRLRGKHQEVLRTGHRRPDRGEAGFLRRATNKPGTRDAPRRAYPEPTRQPPEEVSARQYGVVILSSMIFRARNRRRNSRIV